MAMQNTDIAGWAFYLDITQSEIHKYLPKYTAEVNTFLGVWANCYYLQRDLGKSGCLLWAVGIPSYADCQTLG